MADIAPEITQLLKRLLVIEAQLGHVVPNEEYLTKSANDLDSDDDDHDITEHLAETTFDHIVWALHNAEFTDEFIVKTINQHVRSAHGPPYCNLSEVRDALGRKPDPR